MSAVESVKRPVDSASVSDSVTQSRSQFSHLWILAGILLLAAAVRIPVGLWFSGLQVPIDDAIDYERLAVGLVEQRSYLTPAGDLSSLRPPLYPAIVAGLYEVFGLHNNDVVRIFQGCLGLLTGLLTYLLGQRLYGPRIGLVACAVVSLYPSLLGFGNLILSETLFTFLLTAALLAAVTAIQRTSLTWLAVTGVLLGLGALTRSVLWVFTPVVGAYMLLVFRSSWPKRLLAAAMPVLLFGITVAPWAIRNTELQKTFTLIDVMGGRNVMMGNYQHTPLERSWATVDLRQGELEWIHVLAQTDGPLRGMTQGQIDKLAMRHGLKFAFSHPWLTLKRSTVKFFNFWQLERTIIAGLRGGFFGQVPLAVVILIAGAILGTYVLTLFAAIFGICTMPMSDRRIHWLFLLTIVFMCGIHSIAFAHSRYHLPLIPVLAVYAAAALINRRQIFARRGRSFALAGLLCLVVAGGWAREIIMVDLTRASEGPLKHAQTQLQVLSADPQV